MIRALTYYTVACDHCARLCEDNLDFWQDCHAAACAHARAEGWQAEHPAEQHLCPYCLPSREHLTIIPTTTERKPT